MNWTLDDIQVGMFVIPEGYNVYGNPSQCLPVVGQICHTLGLKFGLYSFPFGHENVLYNSASDLVRHLNNLNYRLLTRKELCHLVLYMGKDNFATPPEDQPLDNG